MKIFNIQKKYTFFGIAIGIVVALAVDLLFTAGAFKGMENKAFDLRVKKTRNNKKPNRDISLILIDEASLKAMDPVVGRWPWPRSVYGDILDFLTMGGAKAVIFDVLFTEYQKDDINSADLGFNDLTLMETTAAAGNVYHAAQLLIDEEDEKNKDLLNKPMPAGFVDRFSLKNIDKSTFRPAPNNNFYLPFAELYDVSQGVGIVEFTPDNDGVYRRTRLFRHYNGSYFPVISMAYLLSEIHPDMIRKVDNKIIMDELEFPLLDDGNYLINMYGDFENFSISGVLTSIQKMQQGEVEDLYVAPEEFANKIVLIGASAVGVEDLKMTPIGDRVPGVMIHASILSNMLDGDFLRTIPKSWTRAIIYLGSITLGLLILYVSPLFLKVLLPLIAVSVYAGLSFAAFKKNIVLDMAPPVVSSGVVWISAFIYLYFAEGKDKRKVRRMLGQYVSPAVLTELVDSPGDCLKAEVGKKENLTMLFSDIRGFTTISEHMEAEKVVALLNRYLSSMVDVIFRYNGTLDKFIGDAVMAFWGAPIRVGDHGVRAVTAALEMTKNLENLNKEFAAEGLPELRIGLGLHTGEVVLGNIGSEKKLDYTVIGDNVNLTSRLEGLTKGYECDILISETTYNEIRGEFPCRIVDHVRVKGKKRPIKIYSVCGSPDDEAEKQELNGKICRYTESAFLKYMNGEFEESYTMYSKLYHFIKGDRISEIFMSRCREYLKNPPSEEWDGVFTVKNK